VDLKEEEEHVIKPSDDDQEESKKENDQGIGEKTAIQKLSEEFLIEEDLNKEFVVGTPEEKNDHI
jgi:hypothetical protein